MFRFIIIECLSVCYSVVSRLCEKNAISIIMHYQGKGLYTLYECSPFGHKFPPWAFSISAGTLVGYFGGFEEFLNDLLSASMQLRRGHC